jgi:signal transduction histidine kinase
MPVTVQANHRRTLAGLIPSHLAVDETEQGVSSRHASCHPLATDRHGEFLAMVLHELQNPLGNILAGVAFVRETEGSLRQSEWLWTGLENAARQVQGLLTDLIDLCQATHPTFQLRRKPVDLAAAARAVVKRRRDDFERAGLMLTVAVGAEPAWVTADPERLELVLYNLLDNAAKYTEAGGRVRVSVEIAKSEVVFRVQDSGVGISPEVLPFVFDPFVREQVPGVRRRRGSGIGLLLVRTLVELHGGRVEVSSAGRGQGSEFVVRLPHRTWPPGKDSQ